MRTANMKFLELCEEIDSWKEEAQYWKEKYEEATKEHHEYLNESLLSAQKGVANALMFCLSAKDDENGNLVIDRQARRELNELYEI